LTAAEDEIDNINNDNIIREIFFKLTNGFINLPKTMKVNVFK
jgi:hypothetical protein